MTPTCCCPSPDAWRCVRMRYHNASDDELLDDGPCSCACHPIEFVDDDDDAEDAEDTFVRGHVKGWNDCVKDAFAAIANARRRHRDAVAKMREQARRKDLSRKRRARLAYAEDDRLSRRQAGVSLARPHVYVDAAWLELGLSPSEGFRLFALDYTMHGPKGELP